MTKHEFDAFEKLCRRVDERGESRWAEIQSPFLRAVEKFDAAYATGKRSAGWYKAKARYFNDLIIKLLHNWSGQEVVGPVKRDSQIFDKIDIDICFPGEGIPRAAAEVKVLGTPAHPGNNQKPRPGKSDLHKRAREVAFTATDLKVAYAKPKKIKTFKQWVLETEPAYFSFWAIRVEDRNDFEKVRSILVGLSAYCNGVGALLYEPVPGSEGIVYRAKKVPELRMDKALRDMAQRML